MDTKVILLVVAALLVGVWLLLPKSASGPQLMVMPGAPGTSSDARLSEAELLRTSQGGGIEVSAVYMNPIMKDRDLLVFKVALDTHFGSLSAIDLTQRAALRNSEGVVIDSGFTWEPISESGHHRLGYLRVDPEGVFIGRDTEYIELELKDIGGVPSRTFRWELNKLGPES